MRLDTAGPMTGRSGNGGGIGMGMLHGCEGKVAKGKIDYLVYRDRK